MAPPDPPPDHRALANFLFEVGMLKRTPRSGLAFLGSGADSVAEHILRTTYIAFALGRLTTEVDAHRLVLLCLLHDLPEARTGDLNYENKKYVEVDEHAAIRDLARTLPFGDEIQRLWEEFEACETREAKLAHDCDQLELLLVLKEERDRGNPQADSWVPFALRRLREPLAKELARCILSGHSGDWWFEERDDWWVWGGRERPDADSAPGASPAEE
jgi:putative hydrolase of HD superfamily